MAKRIAIAGAGIGGLTSALLLAKAGFDVTIFEKSREIGGRIGFIGNGTYKIDRGPTIVLLPQLLLKILKEAGIDTADVELIRCDPLYRVESVTGESFIKYADAEKQADYLNRFQPVQSHHFKKYLSKMSGLFTSGFEAVLSRSFHNKKAIFSRGMLSLLTSGALLKSADHLSKKYFQSSFIRDAYALQTLYIGGVPHATPGLYSLISYSEHVHGIWYIKGGYASLLPLIREACDRLSVEIKTDSAVDELIIEDGVCRGVESCGKRYAADAVIYNGDFPGIYPLMKKAPPKERKFRPSSGTLLIYAGVNKRWEDDVAHRFFMPERFKQHMNEVFNEEKVPGSPAFYSFNPVVLDKEAAPAGKSVLYFLIPVPAGEKIDWQQEAGKLAERIIEEAENRKFTGLKENIEWLEWRTPDDFSAEGYYKGGAFGIAPTLSQSGFLRPQLKPFSIKGLYSVGASVHPGGGVPIVMQGASLLRDIIIEELSDHAGM